jgi:hypothetical protein
MNLILVLGFTLGVVVLGGFLYYFVEQVNAALDWTWDIDEEDLP